jgi:hypothetical protein
MRVAPRSLFVLLAVLLALPVVALSRTPGEGLSMVPRTVDPTDEGETRFLDLAYRSLLGRSPDPDGASYWLGRLRADLSPDGVLDTIASLPEHRQHLVRSVYAELLGREPEGDGLRFWSDALAAGMAPAVLRALVLGSEEYLAVRSDGTPAGFVDAVYADLLGRPPDPGGRTFWTDVVARGTPRWSVALSLSGSEEAAGRRPRIVAASPPAGALVETLPPVDVSLDRSPGVDSSPLLLSVAGRTIPATSTIAGTTLRAEPAGPPDHVAPGATADVVATALVADGATITRIEHRFRYRRPGPVALPRGGRSLFPEHRLVAHYGSHATPALGILGEGTPTQAAARVNDRARSFERQGGPTVLPVFEMIATLALASPGPGGTYSSPSSIAELRPYLEAVREVQGLLVLDIQPGRADWLDEVRRYEELLLEPDVGLALDPEWSVGPDETPGGGTIGSIDAADVNRVSAYLADLVDRRDLPEKLLVVHRFTAGMVTNDHQVVDRPGVAIVFHADGIGSVEAKLADYRNLLPDRFARGIKVFLNEDPVVLGPDALLGLEPPPDLVTYQ